MSQIFGSVSGSPSVATSYVTDNGTATPAANILNILGVDSTDNNNNGISTAAPGSSNTVTVILTNRLQGEDSTVGAVNGDIVTFPLGASAGTFTFDINISAFNSSTLLAAGYKIFGTVRTTGAAATLIGTPDKVVHEEGALSAANADLVVSGNSAIIRVLGVAGLTINWGATATYVYRGA